MKTCVITFMLLFATSICAADIVYLTNGYEIEGHVEQTTEGVWIEGLLFTKDEVERVEKKPFKRKAVKKEPWYQGIASLFGFKSAEEKRLEEHKERLNKKSEMIKEMDKTFDKEREQARRATSATMSKARRATQKAKANDRQRKRAIAQASEEWRRKSTYKPKSIKLLNKTLVGEECATDSLTGKDTCRKIYEMR